MQVQNFQNHTRLHPLFHYFLAPVSFLGAVISFVLAFVEFSWIKISFGLVFLLIHLVAFVARSYAKKNQDRIIRTELRLRYFLLTHQDFTSIEDALSVSQLVALRFAHDHDFLTMVNRHDLPTLSPKQIKQEFVSWKEDDARV